MKPSWRASAFAVLLGTLLLAGCRYLNSGGLTVALVNHEAQPVTNLALSYPGGSFGLPVIPPNGSDSRWVKPLFPGPLEIEFDDGQGHHSLKLLSLSPHDRGTVILNLWPGGEIAVSDERRQGG